MDEEEDNANDEADAAHHDVGDPKEGVLAPQDAGGGDDNRLCPGELSHWIVVADHQLILHVGGQSLLEFWANSVLHTPKQLPEVGQGRSTHPDDEILILESVIGQVTRHWIYGLSVKLPDIFLPIHWFHSSSILERFLQACRWSIVLRVLELILFVTVPSYPGSVKLYKFRIRVQYIRGIYFRGPGSLWAVISPLIIYW